MAKNVAIPSTILVLNKKLVGEKGLQYSLFSQNLGKIVAYKNAGKTAPDIFECAQCLLEPMKGGQVHVMKEYNLCLSFSDIGKDYTTLYYASKWAHLIWHNLDYIENLDTLFDLSIQALDAFSKKPCSQGVYLKSLYKLLKQEGYAVKEDWLFNLLPSLKIKAHDALFKALEKKTPEDLDRILDQLYKWISLQTPFKL